MGESPKAPPSVGKHLYGEKCTEKRIDKNITIALLFMGASSLFIYFSLLIYPSSVKVRFAIYTLTLLPRVYNSVCNYNSGGGMFYARK